MIRAGFVTVDPRTGTRTRVVKGAEETDGGGWVLEVECPVGAPPHIVEHVHSRWTETFDIVRGTARYKLDGEERTVVHGASILMPAGEPHIHPWNAGDDVMIYRQTNDFGQRCPDALDDVIGAFATLDGLAREGKTGGRGLPRNPLQLAASLRALVKHEGYDAAVPIPVQRFTAATLGRFAEALGYRAVYPRYLDRSPEA